MAKTRKPTTPSGIAAAGAMMALAVTAMLIAGLVLRGNLVPEGTGQTVDAALSPLEIAAAVLGAVALVALLLGGFLMLAKRKGLTGPLRADVSIETWQALGQGIVPDEASPEEQADFHARLLDAGEDVSEKSSKKNRP